MGAEYLFDGASAVLLAYDPLKPQEPDPERWLPKKQRSGTSLWLSLLHCVTKPRQ